MPEPDSYKKEVRARLRRLPLHLLLALINGTAILVIVAAILGLLALSEVNHLADNVASTMTDAVLSRINLEPQQVLATFKDVAADVDRLVGLLKQARSEGPSRLVPEVEKLSERLSALRASIKQLDEARSSLVDEAITRIGRALAETLQKECKPKSMIDVPFNFLASHGLYHSTPGHCKGARNSARRTLATPMV